VLTAVNPMGEKLWLKGLYSGQRPGIGVGMRVISATSVYSETSAVITAGTALGLLYRIDL
jgi:aminoglycoside 3-N-acetyltransferase